MVDELMNSMLFCAEQLSLIFMQTFTLVLKPYRLNILPTWEVDQGLILYFALNEDLI